MRLIIVAAFATIAAATARTAESYPRFQLSTGTARCQDCHVSPGGGGLIDDYGRLEAGDTISRGGDGALLHGAWDPPDWIRLGGDVRAATALKQQDGEREAFAFPMQAELYAAVGGRGVTAYIAAGLRGGARDPQPALVERLASREHYVMYQRDALYIRAGRFFPIFGLRTADHTAYTRRYLGFGILEEPYGVAAGWAGTTWEGHVHAYVPRPVAFLGAGPRSRGVAASYERRFLEDRAALGAQVRWATSEVDRIATAGGVGKRWFDRAGLLLQGELDVQHQDIVGDLPGRWQLAAHAGATQTLARGLLLGLTLHRWQPDLGVRSARDAVDVDVQWFPWAHVELHLLGRVSAQGNNFDEPGFLSLLQLHYYL